MILTEKENVFYSALKGGKKSTPDLVDACDWRPGETRSRKLSSAYGTLRRLSVKGLVKKVELNSSNNNVRPKIGWEISGEI